MYSENLYDGDVVPVPSQMTNKILEVLSRYSSNDLEHSLRVAKYASLIGHSLDLSDKEMRLLSEGAFLHDIGKINIPKPILEKPGHLTQEERDVIKTHPYEGYLITSPFYPQEVADIVLLHHASKKMDPYPEDDFINSHIIDRNYDILSEKDTRTLAEIVALADLFDALLTDRPYKKVYSKSSARDIITEEFSGETGYLEFIL
ncbi:MAG: HD-GYP domain-containing protein [Candidatus Woesearchaeota archaeon]